MEKEKLISNGQSESSFPRNSFSGAMANSEAGWILQPRCVEFIFPTGGGLCDWTSPPPPRGKCVRKLANGDDY